MWQTIDRQTRWASNQCATNAYNLFSIIKGVNSAIRKAIFDIDKGCCRMCGVYSESWDADHIIAVQNGGGGCDISNFQTLCKECHKEKHSTHKCV